MHYLTAILRSIQARSDDDMVDRINYYYTSGLILMFAILVSAKQYVGYPIQCWVPAHFTESMEQYTENYCWVQNTWFLPLYDYVPKVYQVRDDKQIIYYQWVPFILTFQALLFYVPCYLWRILNWQTGIDVQGIVEMSIEARGMADESSRSATVSTVVHYLEDAINRIQPQQPYTTTKVLAHQGLAMFVETEHWVDIEPPSRRKRWRRAVVDWCCFNYSASEDHPANQRSFVCSSYVLICYMLIKVLYCSNILFQFLLINFFMSSKEPFFGVVLVRNLIKGYGWHDSGVFPRVTLCDFEVKVMGNLHRHTVQCVLMINMFNEKIFLFLWFWFAFVLLSTFFSVFYWLIAITSLQRRVKLVQYHLKLQEYRMNDDERSLLRNFVSDYLHPDGAFVIKMISSHAGNIITNMVCEALWESYKEMHIDRFHKNKNPFLVSDKSGNGAKVSLLLDHDETSDHDNDRDLVPNYKSAPVTTTIYATVGQQHQTALKTTAKPKQRKPSIMTSLTKKIEENQLKKQRKPSSQGWMKMEKQEDESKEIKQMLAGDRDMRKAGVRESGKYPSKEFKLAGKSMFKSGKYESNDPDNF